VAGRRRRAALLATAVVLVAVAAAGCKEPPRPPAPGPAGGTSASASAGGAEPLSEQVVRIPLEGRNAGLTLESTLFRPSGPGPFPLVVLNHGAIGKANPSPRWRPVEHARWFTARGLAVLVPMRRGNAGSDGAWAEGFGSCESPDYRAASLEAASDIRAAIAFITRRPWVEAGRVLLHGMSAGAFAALTLASTSPSGVVGVLNFAGGRGSLTDDHGATRYNCGPEKLVELTRELGGTVRVPTLWLYALNDRYFPPSLARRMFDAFRGAGGSSPAAASTFVALPAFGRDGHNFTWRPEGLPLWTPHVERFLIALGLTGH
jgi:dienelactone hydrolase